MKIAFVAGKGRGLYRRWTPICIRAVVLVALLTACAPNETASIDESDPTGSQLALNPLETKITQALGALGVDSERVEYSFNGAFMWAQFDGESALFVSAYPIGTDRGDFAVLSERSIEGTTVKRVEYSTGPIRDRFDCVDATYEVDGAVPPDFDTFEEFLQSLIPALGCGVAGSGS